MNKTMSLWFLGTVMLTFCQRHGSWAWLSSSSSIPSRRASSAPFSLLHQSLSSSSSYYDEPILRRATMEGVSLAPSGFWIMLRVAEDGYLPWQVTDDPQDAYAATSPEALTLIQLLSGVDLAGAILPPDVLARLVVLHCERQHENIVAQAVLDHVQQSLPNATVAYSEVHPWGQSRVKLPTASLDEVSIEGETFSLTCSVRDLTTSGSLTFTPSQEDLESVLYQFSPSTSLAFTSLALALRYQAPVSVTLQQQQTLMTLSGLQTNFPMYATVSTLQKQSNRVQENIVRGFEIHKLQGALRIAMERGDLEAAAKIRQALDEYDSMDQLPTADFEQEDGGLLQRNWTMSDVMQ